MYTVIKTENEIDYYINSKGETISSPVRYSWKKAENIATQLNDNPRNTATAYYHIREVK